MAARAEAGCAAAEPTGLVGNVVRYALHDGPGIRTTVFLKGCPLRCPWCHNPELLRFEPEISLDVRRCLGCGDCARACPSGAVGPGLLRRDGCSGCGACARACPTGALSLVGERRSVSELVELVLRDRRFYEASGGGVSCSGGEPTGQLAFLGEFLRRLKAEGVHTCLETSGLFPWEEFERRVLPWVDLVLFDVKLADGAEHRRLTGVENSGILANLGRLAADGRTEIVARVPLVPGFTADPENVRAVSALLTARGVDRRELLPYSPLGLSKAPLLGREPDPRLSPRFMGPEEVAAFADCIHSAPHLTPGASPPTP